MSRIALHELVKTWGAVNAVDRVSFVSDGGELTVLLGPSGCGKSTTLRLIAGLEDATSGRIEIAGRDVTRLPPSERRIAMVFQSYALFPHLTVAENIVFGLRVRRVAAAERDARLKRVADIVGLAHLLDRKPAQLSGGQRQRVALGRAIIAEAPACLMDEPLSNLDAQLRHEMRTEIRALQQRLGMTMVYVTHDQTEAMTMADRIVLMRDGRIEQEGTPDDLYMRPATTFAARFLGTPPMNVLPAARFGQLPAGLDPGRLSVGLRPERLLLADAATASLVGTVGAVEFLGADTVLVCTVGEDRFMARVPGHPRLRAGESAGFRFSPDDLHFFDTASGRRIEPAGAAPVRVRSTINGN